MVLGLWGAWYSWRAAQAQTVYARMKFGDLQDEGFEVKHPLAESAHAIYPHNYYLTEYLASLAFKKYQQDPRDSRYLDLAHRWLDDSLEQNRYLRESRWLEAKILGVDDPRLAARVWSDYVERVFWNSWNLAGLVYWQALAGERKKAEATLELLKGRPHYQWAADTLNASVLDRP